MSECFVGVDIGGAKMLLTAVGEGLQQQRRMPTGPTTGPAELSAAIGDFVAHLPNLPVAIGIAVPGLVDPLGQVVDCDVLPNLRGWRVAESLGNDFLVYVMNDVEAALVEEASGLPPRANVAVVMVGTGIGAAFLVDGAVCRGARGWAGELGHIPIVVDGESHSLDELASGSALLRLLDSDFEAILAACQQGDAGTLATVRKAGRFLGLGLSTVIHLFNPQRIVLGGGALRYPGYIEAACASAEQSTMRAPWEACEILRCRHPHTVVALGAARVARDRSRHDH